MVYQKPVHWLYKPGTGIKLVYGLYIPKELFLSALLGALPALFGVKQIMELYQGRSVKEAFVNEWDEETQKALSFCINDKGLSGYGYKKTNWCLQYLEKYKEILRAQGDTTWRPKYKKLKKVLGLNDDDDDDL